MATSTTQEPIRFSLVISSELNELLENLARYGHTTKSDVLRRAIALFDIAFEATRNNKHLGILDQNNNLETEIEGLL
jgi:predicted transcriptional regulator